MNDLEKSLLKSIEGLDQDYTKENIVTQNDDDDNIPSNGI